jgi:hypothetical protein
VAQEVCERPQEAVESAGHVGMKSVQARDVCSRGDHIRLHWQGSRRRASTHHLPVDAVEPWVRSYLRHSVASEPGLRG